MYKMKKLIMADIWCNCKKWLSPQVGPNAYVKKHHIDRCAI